MSQVDTGLQLRTARLSLGLSVARVSDLVGTSVSTIKRWEAGAGLPSATELAAYLEKIGAPTSCICDLPKDETGGRVAQRMLRAKRRRAMFSLEEISFLTGICVASLHRYETGRRTPEPSALASLARAYGCSREEIELLCEGPKSAANSAVAGFLQPGEQPHFWLYHRLEEKLRPGAALLSDDLLDIVHGFMIMGDHRSLLEAWELLRPAVQQLKLSREDALAVGLTVALARFTVTGDKKFVEGRMAKLGDDSGGLPLTALSHAARLSLAIGELDEAEAWINKLSFHASRVGDEGQIFVSEVSRVMLAFARTRSPSLLLALDRLRTQAQGALQIYTLDVAELFLHDQLGDRTAAREVLQRCLDHEMMYGVGSPLATRIRKRA
jgi:transcriptional regulator with XRE-family HTH domain